MKDNLNVSENEREFVGDGWKLKCSKIIRQIKNQNIVNVGQSESKRPSCK